MMKGTMRSVILLAVALLPLSACSGRAPTVRAELKGFVIVSELNDPASRSTTVIITVPLAFTPNEIKAAAESVIGMRQQQFARITVKSFVEGADLNGVPLAVSKFEAAGVDHVFNASLP